MRSGHLFSKDDQFRLQGLEVDDVEGTNKHCQSNQRHGRADNAVEDEAEEDEGVVAVVGVKVAHHPLAQFTKVAGLGELPVIHEASPETDGRTATSKPLLGHTGPEAFGQPQPSLDTSGSSSVGWLSAEEILCLGVHVYKAVLTLLGHQISVE